VEIAGETYRAAPGTLFRYGPGVTHRLEADDTDPFVLYGVHFAEDGDLPEDAEASLQFEITEVPENYVRSGDRLPPVPGYAPCSRTGMWPLPYFESLADEYHDARPMSPLFMRGVFLQLAVLLSRWEGERLAVPFDRMLLRLRERLDRTAEQPFAPAELERLCGYSYDYIARLFKSRFHVTPYAYHTERKAAVAERLLTETALSITAIAERLHFASIHHFSKWFKRLRGEVPSAYRSRRRIL